MDSEEIAELLFTLVDDQVSRRSLTTDEAGVSENARTGGFFFEVSDPRGRKYMVEVTRSQS